MRLAALAALALALLLTACAKPDVAYDQGVFLAKGWRGAPPSAGWPAAFAIYAGDLADAPPLLGDYARSGATIRFTPRYPPSAGLRLKAVYRPPGAAPIERMFTQPGAAVASSGAQVVAIYPSTDVLPENQLKLYVAFSKPMQHGAAWTHLQILDAAGAVVQAPFVEIDQELWDPQGQRLTILFDPGRIKRGVLPNEQVGAPLKPGQSYRFVVRKGWPAADGTVLTTDAVKAFTVAPAERRPIVLADWRIAAPRAGSHDPLIVNFPRPLDRALLADALQVIRDTPVPGTVTVGPGETTWRFTPQWSWSAGDYVLRVETRIEDLAGNRIGRAFDVDTLTDDQPRIVDKAETIAFRIAG